MSNSSLVNYTLLSPHNSGQRNHEIDTISIHCMAGDMTVESCGSWFSNSASQASSNYGIGSDGRIGLYVEECNRSWCTSSSSNDNRAITIEVANTQAKDPYPISEKAYESLINLLVDICERNGIEKLLWQGDSSLIGQVDKQNMTVHRWFQNKSCPGATLYNLHGTIASEVNQRLEVESMRYNTIDEIPDYAKETIQKLIDKGLLAGDGSGLNLSEDMIRMFVINDRAGVYDGK